MKAALLTARILLGVTGTAVVLLGILLWTGHGPTLIPLHMEIGAVFVLSLWLLVILGAWARVGVPILVLTAVLSLVVPVLGVRQMALLPGSLHGLVQVTHLLVGVAAVGLGQLIYRRARKAQPAKLHDQAKAA